MVDRRGLLGPVGGPNLYDKSGPIVEVPQIQHAPIAEVDANIFPGVNAQPTDSIDWIARAKRCVRRGVGSGDKNHTRVLHHWLEAALGKEEEPHPGPNLIRHVK